MKDVDGFPGYKIDASGRVWSFRRGGVKELRQYIDKDGYLFVVLFVDGARKNCSVHLGGMYDGPRAQGF
jgi:hypothetical protein